MAFENGYAFGYMLDPNRSQTERVKQLVDRFNEARFQGRIASLLGSLFGRSSQLLDLGAVHSRPAGSSSYAGTRPVRISQIRGSEGRCQDFDREFNPRSEKNLNRWLSVAQAKLDGSVLPPVALIQVGDIYFVRDGHHRISVAHALGEEYIDAEIILEN
jgi:hypothetical protein